MAEEYKDVDDEQFINELQLWMLKQGTYPLELITFVKAKNGTKLIAIPSYGSEEHYFLGAKSYESYQAALTKVGSLMDKMDVQKHLEEYKSTHPLSFPDFTPSADDQIKGDIE